MKTILIAIALMLVTATGFAGELTRVLPFKLDQGQKEVSLNLFYTMETSAGVYYRGSMEYSTQIVARAEKADGGYILKIIDPDEDTYLEVFLPEDAKYGSELEVLVSGKATVKTNKRYRRNYFDYWYDATLTEETNVEVEFLGDLTKYDPSYKTNELKYGKLEFSECDGCEHGDRLLIGDLDVLPLGLGDYYEGDCPGKLHPMINQLIALGVEFKFEGRLSAMTSDLWEENWWVANEGTLSIAGTKRDLLTHLEIVVKTALKENVGAKAADVRSVGKFYNYGNDKLLFKYNKTVVVSDLNTGAVYAR